MFTISETSDRAIVEASPTCRTLELYTRWVRENDRSLLVKDDGGNGSYIFVYKRQDGYVSCETFWHVTDLGVATDLAHKHLVRNGLVP